MKMFSAKNILHQKQKLDAPLPVMPSSLFLFLFLSFLYLLQIIVWKYMPSITGTGYQNTWVFLSLTKELMIVIDKFECSLYFE